MIEGYNFENLILDKDKNLVLQKGIMNRVSADDAFFETLFTTICGSDLRILAHGDSRIKEPRVLGHEVVARVLSPGSRKDFSSGDFVAIGADIPCGNCLYCARRQENLCREHLALGYQIDGGLSSVIQIPGMYLQNAPIVRISPKNYPEAYSLAEPAGCVIHGIEFSSVNQEHRMLIVGGGPIGIMIGKVSTDLVGMPAKNLAFIEPFEYRRNFIEKMGIKAYADLSKLSHLKENLFDRVFTATSNPKAHEEILPLLNHGGRVNFFGGVPKDSSKLIVDANLLHYSEISLEGSHGSCPRHHKKATELIARDEAFWANLITLKISLNELEATIPRIRQGLEMKVAVDFHRA